MHTTSALAPLLVFLGGGAGAVLRYGVGVLALRMGYGGAWATMAINIAGGLAIGLLAAWVSASPADPQRVAAKLLLGVGVLGGFTTFSAFALDIATLFERRAVLSAALLAGGSVAGAVLAAAAGLALGRRLLG